MLVRVMRPETVATLDRATGGELGVVIEMARRRGPYVEVHVIGGQSRNNTSLAPVALAVVVIEDGAIFGFSVFEVTDPNVKATVARVAAIDIAAAHGVAAINMAIMPLMNDPVGSKYDFGLMDD